MSRLSSLSPAALKAMFSPETDDTLLTLLTLSGANIVTPVRLVDGYTQRISETADEVVYGVVSRSNDYVFLPFDLSLPTEDEAAPRCHITVHDVGRDLVPIVRDLDGAPTVQIELVLASAPDVVEVSFGEFLLGSVSYSAGSLSGDLVVDSLAVEPFPAHTFTPSAFPGLF